ncbi:MAG TPA: hypothetical protein VIE43_27425 [Thermoanaerobaculia bacterium]|nr:hypothetical protein [Thermoanaerobaculia bacterium]
MKKRNNIHRIPYQAGWLIGAVLISLTLTAAPAAAQNDPGYLPVTGKWTRGAADAVAWVDLATWKLVTRFAEQPSIASSDPQPNPWLPVTGDWNGAGIDTVQMFNVYDWRLIPLEKGPATTVAADPDPSPWRPVAGNWDGRGVATVSVFDLRDGSIHRLAEGPIEVHGYVPAANPWQPLVGDWDGKGRDTIATYRDEEKAPDTASPWTVVAGDWQGRGIDTVAFLHRPTGTLVLPEKSTASKAVRDPASSSDKVLQLPDGCYQKNTDYASVTKVLSYGGGSGMSFVIESSDEWTCCPIDANEATYSCGEVFKTKTHS